MNNWTDAELKKIAVADRGLILTVAARARSSIIGAR